MITSQEIIYKIDEALRLYGEYNYEDKGASEVMDVDKIALKLEQMPNNEIIKVLTEVKEKHNRPNPFLIDITMYLIDAEEGVDAKIDELAKDPFWAEYY